METPRHKGNKNKNLTSLRYCFKGWQKPKAWEHQDGVKWGIPTPYCECKLKEPLEIPQLHFWVQTPWTFLVMYKEDRYYNSKTLGTLCPSAK